MDFGSGCFKELWVLYKASLYSRVSNEDVYPKANSAERSSSTTLLYTQYTWRPRGLSKQVISRVIIWVTLFRVLTTLLTKSPGSLSKKTTAHGFQKPLSDPMSSVTFAGAFKDRILNQGRRRGMQFPYLEALLT